MVLQNGDLTSSQDGFEGQTDEELGGGREEGAERVGGGCDDRVDAKEGAEEEGCR
jgi:hypothetical protein